jgi:hypothetical protein
MYVRTPEQLLEKLELQKENVPEYKGEIGATDDDIAEITRDKNILSEVISRANIVEAGKKTTNSIKDHVYDGDENIQVVDYPTLPNDAPSVPYVGGCLSRFKARNRRFKAAKGYTATIGVALGIEVSSDPVSPESVVPTLDAMAAKTGYVVAVVVGNRAESSMWKIFGRRMNSEKREELASGTGKSADITVSPTVAGQPEKIELTAQLYKNNEAYGQPSDAVSVTVSP